MKRILYALLVFVMMLSFNRVFAAEATIATEEEIAEMLKGEGVEITNLKFTGMPDQFGKFEDAGDIVGFENIDEGIILSTGRAEGMFVPAYNFISTSYCAYMHGGDFDVASIDFDAVSESEYISFQYIFASEEFDQPPMFNDLMTIEYWKSGESPKNIALLPGSTDGICINNLRNTCYHYDNIVGEDLGYLGYTSLLSCQADVEADETYHFRITIKDLGDPIYDSAVFIKAHSVKKDPAPPPEKNPHPPTRGPGSINFIKEVNDVKLTLSTGEVLQEINLEDGSSLHKEGFTVIDDSMVVVTLDDVVMQGATLEVEYKLTIENKTGDICIKYDIEDFPSDNYVYRSEQELLTEEGTNMDYGWKISDDDGTIKSSKEGSEAFPVIYPLQSIEKKIVLSRVLTNDLDDEDYIFENSAKATITTVRGSIEKEDEAMKVQVLPPFGRTVRSFSRSFSRMRNRAKEFDFTGLIIRVVEYMKNAKFFSNILSRVVTICNYSFFVLIIAFFCNI